MEATHAPPLEDGSQQLVLVVVSVVLMVLTAFVISFRLYTRLCISKKVFLEDGLILVGTLCAIGLSSVYTAAAYHGFGQHLTDITRLMHSSILHKLSFAIPMLYLAAMFFIRASFLALYHRLDHRKPMRWTVYILLAIILGQAVAAGVVHSLAYVPPSHLRSDPGYYSHFVSRDAAQTFSNANGIIMVVTSLAIYIVPFFMLHNLGLPSRQKWAVSALFALGFLSVIATCVKDYYAWTLYNDPHVFYKMTRVGIWNQVEVHVAILCGSAQLFRVLLKEVFPRCCRASQSDAASDDSSLSPPVIWPPPPSMSYRSDVSAVHDSWRGWEDFLPSDRCDSAVSRGSRNWKQVADIKRNPGVVTMPAMVHQQYLQLPSITTRLSQSNDSWTFQAAVKRHTPPWPLPNSR